MGAIIVISLSPEHSTVLEAVAPEVVAALAQAAVGPMDPGPGVNVGVDPASGLAGAPSARS
jgi:hypothetical protein